MSELCLNTLITSSKYNLSSSIRGGIRGESCNSRADGRFAASFSTSHWMMITRFSGTRCENEGGMMDSAPMMREEGRRGNTKDKV